MVESIIDDIKEQFRSGNMITRLILVNLFVMLALTLIDVFTPPGATLHSMIYDNLALTSGNWTALKKPWTLLTHAFVHKGIWHFGWNMLMLYWFGRIVGDLIGDRKILPLYILGALAGGLFFLLYAQLIGWVGYPAHGASGAVMAFVIAAGFLAPDYIMHLLLIGAVRLKYISAALFVIDFVMLANGANPGGRIAHIGGAIMGGVFVYLLRQGVDLSEPFDIFASRAARTKPAPMKVVHNKKRPSRVQDEEIVPSRSADVQDRIDAILDKINASGYDSLSAEEKDFLYQASKK